MINKIFIAKIFSFIPDYIFNKLLFRYKIGYWPNFKAPKSYSEKINYIKLYSNNKLRKVVADRIRVREYVKEKAPNCELINILWEGSIFTEDTYNNLPKKFVIKANHGSGMVMIIDKNINSFNDIFKQTIKWQNTDYGKITRQFVYNNVPKTIIVEEFINFNSKVLPDYKFLCVKGKVEFIQVDLDRFDGHARNIYDENFVKMNVNLEYKEGRDISKPILFQEAKEIAENLASDFDFIRIDLYIMDDIIYFGEITNTPGNGFEKFTPINFDLELGNKIIFNKEFEENEI